MREYHWTYHHGGSGVIFYEDGRFVAEMQFTAKSGPQMSWEEADKIEATSAFKRWRAQWLKDWKAGLVDVPDTDFIIYK